MREKKSGNATPHIKKPQNPREIEKLTEMKRERGGGGGGGEAKTLARARTRTPIL